MLVENTQTTTKNKGFNRFYTTLVYICSIVPTNWRIFIKNCANNPCLSYLKKHVSKKIYCLYIMDLYLYNSINHAYIYECTHPTPGKIMELSPMMFTSVFYLAVNNLITDK